MSNTKNNYPQKLHTLRLLSQYRIGIKKYTGNLQEIYNHLKHEDKQRIAGTLYLVFTLLTVSFFGVFAINPTLSTISNLNKQKEDSLRVDNDLKQKLAALRNLDQEYSTYESDIQLAFAAIPTSTKIPYLTRQIETIAEANNVKILRLDFQAIELYPGKKTNIPLYSFTFTINLQGNGEQIDSFLSGIIGFDRIINIDNLTTGKVEGGHGATITGRVYYFR